MASLSNRQSLLRPTSGRMAAAQLGQSQQVVPRPVSGRFMAGQLGPTLPKSFNVDFPNKLHLRAPDRENAIDQYYQLRAAAERLKGQLAAHDQRTSAAHPPAPHGANIPVPFRSRADLQARDRLKQRLLEQANQTLRTYAIPPYLLPQTVVPAAKGSDRFMPFTFWHTQAPDWWDCCNTVKRMIMKAEGKEPYSRLYIVKERGKSLVVGKDFIKGMQKLDEYMDLRKPVMAGVTHTFGMTIKSKRDPSVLLPLNEGTTDHFIAIVGIGYENGQKYYRFFDVGTKDPKRGTSYLNKLYLTSNGFLVGHSQATDKDYTLSQLRF